MANTHDAKNFRCPIVSASSHRRIKPTMNARTPVWWLYIMNGFTKRKIMFPTIINSAARLSLNDIWINKAQSIKCWNGICPVSNEIMGFRVNTFWSEFFYIKCMTLWWNRFIALEILAFFVLWGLWIENRTIPVGCEKQLQDIGICVRIKDLFIFRNGVVSHPMHTNQPYVKEFNGLPASPLLLRHVSNIVW